MSIMTTPLSRRPRILAVALTLVLALTACSDRPGQRGRSPLLANEPATRASGGGTSIYDRFDAALNGPAPERRVTGSDRFLGEGGGNRPLIEASDNGSYTLNLVNVPIDQAARAVLAEALGRTYTIQPSVEGLVTLQTSRPLTEKALLETFQTVLELNGATLQAAGDVITIVPARGVARRIVREGDTAVIGARLVAVPLEHIGTAEMIRLLQPITGDTVELQPIPKRNILLIAGPRAEINAAIDAVNLFDVDVLAGKSVGLFRLKAAEPEAVVEELKFIFETEEGGSLQNVLSFVPSQRLNAVLVVSTRSAYLAKAERWIRDLDRTAGGARRRPVVYDLQHRSAVDLQPILSEMLQDVAAAEGEIVTGAPRVVADDAKNTIIVWGNDSEQEALSRLIQTLDTTPVQVLLEATIAEVSLRDELDFGVRWFFESGRLNGAFSDASNGAVASTFPGLSFLFQGPSAQVALNALSSVTDVNVVSSPSLVVLDNQEARLQIGDEVPIATQQVQDTGDATAPIVNTISFRDTGILLTVKPRVSRSGQVILDIEQEVSSVTETTTSGIDSPTISQRRIETSVVVSDGQTLALGGLIEESHTRSDARVPGVGDVPILGALFRNRGDRVGKTELLILITPRVIRTGGESRAVTEELRGRMNRADGLVTTGIGTPEDGHRVID